MDRRHHIMQAVVHLPNTPTPTLKIDNDFPRPEPGEGKVRIKVEASGVCHTNVFLLSQNPDDPRTYIMGHEVAGRADKIGPNVHDIEKDKLYCILALGSCANHATKLIAKFELPDKFRLLEILHNAQASTQSLTHAPAQPGIQSRTKAPAHSNTQDSSNDLFSRSYYGLGENGGHAEYTVVDARMLVPVPSNVTAECAAVAADAGITAWHAVKRTAGVEKGEKVLINGVASGLGLLAVQCCVYLGAEVYALDMRPSSRKLAEKHGAKCAFSLPEFDTALKGGFTVNCAVDFVATNTTFQKEVEAVRLVNLDDRLRRKDRIRESGVKSACYEDSYPGRPMRKS